jgi:hypothetical protein
LKIFFRGYTAGAPLNREGGHGEGKEGKEEERREGREREGGKEGRGGKGGKGMVPPRFNLVPHRFPWTSYRPGRDRSFRDRDVKNVSRGVSNRDSSFEDCTSLGTTKDSCRKSQ